MNINFLDLFQVFTGSIFPLLSQFLLPLILWVVVPGVVSQTIFKNRQAYPIGAYIGLIGFFTVNPLV